MANQTYSDPYEAANDPQVRSGGASDYYGQILLDMYFAVLVKGMGKVPFDPQQHSVDKRVTAIKMEIIPLAEMNISWPVMRETIAENREWAGIVLPSIKALGLSPREVHNKWGHIVRKETGDTYVSKKDGKTYPVTTFAFVQVFKDEAECRAAYQAFSSGAGTAPAQQQPAPSGNGASKEKETAAKFLKPIVANACMGKNGDLTAINQTLAAALANMPQIAKYFTVDSPEVMTLVMETINGH